MQDMISRYHRRDAVMKISAIALFGAIVFSVAAPFVVPQPPPAAIAPFKPYRAQEFAVVASPEAGELLQEVSAD